MTVVFAAICVSILICGVAFFWSCSSLCACCCRRHPLPMVFFSGVITLLMAASVVLYVVNHGKYVGKRLTVHSYPLRLS